jgi:carbonic anhydrase
MLVTAHGAAVQDRPGWRAALVEVAVALNAASGAYMLQKDLGRGGGGVITALHGVYVVADRTVNAADPVEGERQGLAPAPSDEAGFVAAFGAFARSRRIAALLGTAGGTG